MNWIDDLTGASGQERRQWLAEKGDALSEKLNYYLGPAAAPVNALAQGAAMISPGADFVDMLQSGNELMGSRTAKDAGMAGLGLGAATLGMAIPGTAKGVGEAVEGATKGIRAYHGSPHDFDAFDTSKIGTGEGAQAYGHGLYFAETEDVARNYREALADGFKIDGVPYNATTTKAGATTPGHHAADALSRFKGDKAEAIAWLKGGGPTDVEAAKLLRKAKSIEPWRGHMYEVNINADPADFLDWDAPLSAQKAKGVYVAHNPDITGRDAVHGIAARLGSKDKVPEYLSGRGIPGIKYLDAGSRGAGDGSRNYVVFDSATIEILKKYGLLGAVGGGMGANALAGGQPDEL